MAPGFSIRVYTESMRGMMTEELIRTFGESAKDLPPIICNQYRCWKNSLAVFKAAEVQEDEKEAPGKLSISGHSKAVPSILSNTLDSNKETQQAIMSKLMKQKLTSRVEEEVATVVVEEEASSAEGKRHEVEGSFTREVVNQLEPNKSKVCPDDNLDQESGDQYNEGMRQGNFENKDWNENVEQEEVNQGGLRGAAKDNETKMKEESTESMKFLLKRFPELHTGVQMLVAGSNMSTKCEGKHCDSSGTSKLRESYSNVHKQSESASPADKMDKSEEVKPCPEPGTAAEMEVFSSNLSSGAKRKVDFVSSPTLVEKMKTRTNWQPSEVCKSPYAGTKQKSVPKANTKVASVGEVTKGLKLSDLELHAITFVLEALAVDSNKDLVDIDGINVTATHLKCLLRPVKENAVEKWLCSQIIDCYAAKFNSDWNKGNEMKHALYDGICQWLRRIGKAWIKTGVPWWRLCRHFVQKLVGHDMVFIPMNNSENHWWLCVLYPARNEFQVLDSFNMPKDYAQETKELRCGIHSILQAFMSSSEKLESRWSNYDILNWDIVVKKNIPRQHDGCSCGIFTIKYMQYWNGSEITSPFSQKDMETIRKEMPAELIMSPFNKLTSSKDHVLAMQNF